MNRLSAANIPVNTYTFFGLLGGLRQFTTSIWSGLASIPDWWSNTLRTYQPLHRKCTSQHLGATYVARAPRTLPEDLLHVVLPVYSSLPHRRCIPNFISEHPCHHPLVRGSGVLQSKWHHVIVIVRIRGDERCFFSVLGCQSNLMIPLKGIQEAHPRVSVCGIYQLVNLRHREGIFRACPV